MLVLATNGRFLDREAHLLQRCASMLVSAQRIDRCALQRTEQAERCVLRMAHTIIGAIPNSLRTQNAKRTIQYLEIMRIDSLVMRIHQRASARNRISLLRRPRGFLD